MAVLTGDALVMEDTLQMLVDHTDGLTSETDRKNARDSYMKASILRLYKEGLQCGLGKSLPLIIFKLL